MNRYLKILLIIMLALGASFESLLAYDSHHPDPMSFLNGHAPRRASRKVVKVPTVAIKKPRTTGIQKWRMYSKHKEGKYIVKPEPYSIASKKADPELLGPQRTYQKGEQSAAPSTSTTATAKTESTHMTRATCIALIGQEKFDHYVEKYGGETGAVHRCLVLKRLQGS